MADQNRNDSQKPSQPQYSDEPQQTPGDKRHRAQEEEPASTGGAERGRGSMADDRARKEWLNLDSEKEDPLDNDHTIESDLDDDDNQMDDESEDDGPVR